MDMTFYEAVDLYRKVYQRFEKVEGKPWGINGAMEWVYNTCLIPECTIL